jgi:ABC-type phosphate transport system auxiliary subunit
MSRLFPIPLDVTIALAVLDAVKDGKTGELFGRETSMYEIGRELANYRGIVEKHLDHVEGLVEKLEKLRK